MQLLRLFIGVTLSIIATAAALTRTQAQTFPLDSPDQLKLVNVKAETPNESCSAIISSCYNPKPHVAPSPESF